MHNQKENVKVKSKKEEGEGRKRGKEQKRNLDSQEFIYGFGLAFWLVVSSAIIV